MAFDYDYTGNLALLDRRKVAFFASRVVSPAVEEALAEQRILIFAVRNARRTGWQTAQTRNYTIASMAEESVYALCTDGHLSSLDVLCELELGRKLVVSRNKPSSQPGFPRKNGTEPGSE